MHGLKRKWAKTDKIDVYQLNCYQLYNRNLENAIKIINYNQQRIIMAMFRVINNHDFFHMISNRFKSCKTLKIGILLIVSMESLKRVVQKNLLNTKTQTKVKCG